LKEAIRLDPNNANTHYNLGTVLADNKDVGGAITAFNKAIRLNPKFAQAHTNLGIALRAKGNVGGAILSFNNALPLHPPRLPPDPAPPSATPAPPPSPNHNGARPVAANRAALRLPHDAKTHNNLGNALHAKGDVGGAIDAYWEAICLDPKLAQAHFNLGNA